MTTAMADTEQALALLQDAAVQQARAAASTLDGIVIQSEDEAALVGDNLKAAKDGVKRLKELEAEMLAPLKRQIADRQAALAPIYDELARATSGGNNALLAWDNEKKRRAREERERQEKAAAEAARIAAEEEAITGEPAPPPMDVVPVETPRITRGGASTTFVQRRIAVALEDPKQCERAWLDLTPAARAAAIAAEARGALVIPDDATEKNPVIWRGLRVFKNATVASR